VISASEGPAAKASSARALTESACARRDFHTFVQSLSNLLKSRFQVGRPQNRSGGAQFVEDDDTWDIATSVGATAVLVAARAAETASPHSLIRDHFAGLLISTPKLADVLATMPSAGVDTPEEQAERQRITFHAVQTHFFDAYCVAASTAGIDQVVILAFRAGLTRLPPGLAAAAVIYDRWFCETDRRQPQTRMW
jgi:hypothetical protein